MKLSSLFPLLAFVGLSTGKAASLRPALAIRDFDPNRLANDEIWAKFKCKGAQLMQAMMSSDQDAAKLMNLPTAQSEWTGDLKGW